MSKVNVSFALRSDDLGDLSGCVVALGVAKKEDKKKAAGLSAVALMADGLLEGGISRIVERGVFGAGRGETLLVPGWNDNWVLLVGFGDAAKIDAATFRRAAAAALRAVRELTDVDALVSLLHTSPLPSKHKWAGELPDLDARLDASVEGFVLGSYRFERYKSKKDDGAKKGKGKKADLPSVQLLAADKREAQRVESRIMSAQVIAEGQLRARDLANTPPNVAHPAGLAAEARKLAKELGLSCRVMDVAELKRRKMNGILAVGQGSKNPPCLIVLEHKPRRSKGKPYKRVAVVGKGITFDTGGISIKPAEKMELMKYDKSGACAVLAIMATVARLDLPIHVVGLAACAENMPSGTAYRPGDILTMSNGKTVEVLNTDAEGRMVLADALDHAGSFKPDAVVDLATLTGAIDIALGRHYSGLMGTDEALQERLEAAGKTAGEKVWRMPIGDEYQEQIKGTHGDIVNIGGRSGGALTAAQFLSNFAPENVPWAHLDIAGTAWSEKDDPEAPKGATGVGVRLVSRFLLDLVE